MAGQISVMVDSSNQAEGIRPMGATDNICPKCGADLEIGYGMAGGGMGAYEYCPVSGTIVTKDQDPDE